MTKYIKLHTDSANLLRRLSTALYLLSMIGSLALIGFGLIPLYGQRVNAIVAAVNLFEIVNIFSKSFWPVLCTVLYSAAYFFLAAEIVVEAIRAIPSLKLAFGERGDTAEARNNAATVAYKANTCVTSLLVLIILSSLISPYTLSTLDILAFCGLLAIFIAASVLQLCYLKRELVTAFSAPLGRLLYIALMFTFTFALSRFNVYDFFTSIGNLFSLFGYDGITFRFVLSFLLTDVIAPALHLVTVVLLLILYENSYGTSTRSSICYTAKKVMITMLIFVASMLLIGVFTNERIDSDSITELALTYLDYTVLSLAVYFISFLCKISISDKPFAKDRTPSAPSYTPASPTYTPPVTPVVPTPPVTPVTTAVPDPTPVIPVVDPTPTVPVVDPTPTVPAVDPTPTVPVIDPTPTVPVVDPVTDTDPDGGAAASTPPDTTPKTPPAPAHVVIEKTAKATMSPPSGTPLPTPVTLPCAKDTPPVSSPTIPPIAAYPTAAHRTEDNPNQ